MAAISVLVEGGCDPIAVARGVLVREGEALLGLARRIDGEFTAAVELLLSAAGSVLVTGMGKAGLVGQKISATLASTGTRSHFLHPAEAVHGDLGRIGGGDVVLALSHSGETAELTAILPSLRAWRTPLVAITGRPHGTLARSADIVLELGPLEEACPHGLAPTTSTTAMLALGDALAVAASQMRGFRREDFARFHPGGSLGRRLGRVEDEMRPLAECRVARDRDSVRSVFVQRRRPGRRSGAIMLLDDDGRLAGIFTDSDLARLFENRRDAELDGPVSGVMTRSPKVVAAGTRLVEAVQLMAASKISELPVVDADHRPLGMLDVTDLVPLWPDAETAKLAQAASSLTTDTPEPAVTLPFPNSAGERT